MDVRVISILTEPNDRSTIARALPNPCKGRGQKINIWHEYIEVKLDEYPISGIHFVSLHTKVNL